MQVFCRQRACRKFLRIDQNFECTVSGINADDIAIFKLGNSTTIGGVNYNGSIRKVDPATGQVIWASGLTGNVLGSPSVDGSGVIAAALYTNVATNGVYLINSADGSIIRFIALAKEFAQPVYAGAFLFLAVQGGTLTVYKPPG